MGEKTYKGIDIAHALRVVRVSEVRDLLPALLHSRGGERGVGTEYGTLATLPPDFRNETCADLKDFSRGIGGIGVDERCDKRRNEFGLRIGVITRVKYLTLSRPQTFKPASMSGGMMVSVMADAAIGAIADALMLYFAPSRANVFENAMRPILAAL